MDWYGELVAAQKEYEREEEKIKEMRNTFASQESKQITRVQVTHNRLSKARREVDKILIQRK